MTTIHTLTQTLTQALSMGHYGTYVWAAYGLFIGGLLGSYLRSSYRERALLRSLKNHAS